MNLSKITYLGLFFGILAIGSFFLPWISEVPFAQWKDDPERYIQSLVAQSDLGRDYIWISADKLYHAMYEPNDGYSAYQILFVSGDKYTAKICRILQEDIWGKSSSTNASRDIYSFWLGLKILLIFPISSLLAMIFLVYPFMSRLTLLLCGAVQVGLYAVTRWTLTQMFSIHHDLWLKIGFWICIYSALILGLICWIRWFETRGGAGIPARRRK